MGDRDRDDHPGRGGHHGGGGRGGGHGGGDGSHRAELKSDIGDIHHARDALKDADTAAERKEAREDLRDAQQELKKDWGPNMPKHAGEAHHGGRRKDDDDDDERKKHGGGHGGRKDND